ncbi:MAG: hypothetical protein O2800_03205 [Planctomycetota bacterium]|nr:hypothetical protein [Planctomycetota bacterium]
MNRILFASTVVSALLSSTASAGMTHSWSGAGGAITDSPANFTPAYTEFTIQVSDHLAMEQLSSVDFTGLSHAWAGDVSLELIHNGVSATILFRNGWTGSSAFGDSSNYGGDYSFTDASTNDIWAAANGGSSTYVIPSGAYFASGQDGLRVNIASIFAGMDTFGDWTLRVGDHGPTQTGALVGWGFSVTTVPAPSAIALFAGAASLIGKVRRRR